MEVIADNEDVFSGNDESTEEDKTELMDDKNYWHFDDMPSYIVNNNSMSTIGNADDGTIEGMCRSSDAHCKCY
jgi:hypothetical protein